jgi:hypothetical protein
MTNGASCPSEFALERLRFGELAGHPEESLLLAHLGECSECRQRQRALAETESPELDGAAIWSCASAGPNAGRPAWWRRGRLRWPAIAVAGATAAAAIVMLARHPSPDVLTKGSAARLGVIVKRRDGSTMRIEPGARLSPGDRLRFEVATRSPEANIALVLLDSAGAVTRLAPRGDRPLSIAGGKPVLLDETVELDGNLGAERMVLVSCSHGVDANEVVARARRALAEVGGDPRRVDDLGTGCDEETFSITKVRP